MESTSDPKADSTVWRPPTPESLFRPVAQPHGPDQGDEPVDMLPPPALQGPGERSSVMSIAALLNQQPSESEEQAKAEEKDGRGGGGTVSPLMLQDDEAPAEGAGGKVKPTPANRPVRKAARVSALTLRDLARSEGIVSSTAETSSTHSHGGFEEERDELFEEADDDDEEEEEVGARGGKRRKRAVGPGSVKKRRTETTKSVDPTRSEATGRTTTTAALATGGGGQKGKAMDRRTAHSLIERRRREKINACLQRLTVLVPQCRELREEKVAKEGKRKVSGSAGWSTERKRKGKKKGARWEDDEEDEEEGCAGVGSGKLHKLEILLGTVEYIEQLENRLAELEPGSSSSSSRSSGATTVSTRAGDVQAAAAASEDNAALLLLNLASPELAPVR